MILLSAIISFSIIASIDGKKFDCGRKKVDSPVEYGLNDQLSYVGQWPWLAQLFHNLNGFICGATVISEWHLLTAADCVITTDIEDFHALLGTFDLSNSSDIRSIRKNISEIFIHEDFDRYKFTKKSDGDVAIFKVTDKIQFNAYIQAICLPQLSTNVINVFGMIVGYGRTDLCAKSKKTPTNVLIFTKDFKNCLANDDFYSKRSFCGGSENEKICLGDVGGGFYAYDPYVQRYMLYGIISYIVNPCEIEDDGVFVDVTKFIPWIHEKINFKDPCDEIQCSKSEICKNINGKAKCFCRSGFIGVSPNCFKKCSKHSQCADNQACSRKMCVNLCSRKSMCVKNTKCEAKNHVEKCECEEGYEGNGYSKCSKIETTTVERFECYSNDDCPDDRGCIKNACKNICEVVFLCDDNATCKMKNHQPICECDDGYVGDGYEGCEVKD